jgi:hypothetical protein
MFPWTGDLVRLFCFVTDFIGVRRSWQPRAMVVTGAIVVMVTGILFWRLTGPPATVRVELVDRGDLNQFETLVTTVGCWHDYALQAGTQPQSDAPKTVEQRRSSPARAGVPHRRAQANLSAPRSGNRSEPFPRWPAIAGRLRRNRCGTLVLPPLRSLLSRLNGQLGMDGKP